MLAVARSARSSSTSVKASSAPLTVKAGAGTAAGGAGWMPITTSTGLKKLPASSCPTTEKVTRLS